MTESDESTPQTADEAAVAAVQTVRETAKWLLAACGGVATAIVAGLSLGGLGDLSAWWAALAILGLIVAVIGVWRAIRDFSKVLEPVLVTVDDIGASTDQKIIAMRSSGSLLMPYSGWDDFIEDYAAARDAYLTAVDTDSNVAEATRAWQGLQRRARRFCSQATYLIVAGRFQDARSELRINGAGVVAGVIAIALALPGGDSGGGGGATEESFTPPLFASVELTEADRQTLGLPKNCKARSLDVIVIRGTEEAPSVLSIPTASCPALRFVAGRDEIGSVSYP